MACEVLMSIFQEVVYDNTIVTWTIAAGIALGVTATLFLLKRVLVVHLRKLAQRTITDLDDMFADLLERVKLLFLLVLGIYAASHSLTLTPGMERTLGYLMYAVVLFQLGMWGNNIIAYLIAKTTKLEEYSDASTQTTMSVLRFLSKLLLWSILLLLVLDNFGFNITALIASLGIGGIAIALAAQNILGDLFASLSIAIDKPFIIGDFIIIDSYMGTIEKIGMRTTHIRSLSGELIVFSNTDLLRSRVRNFKRMTERRIVFTLDVEYGTPYDMVEAIPGFVRDIIERDGMTRFERGHFHKYGATSLVYEFVYHVTSPEYKDFMDAQQRINLEIYRLFEDRGIQFAFPTQTVHLVRQSDIPTEASTTRGAS
jgi:small-conductance mechanosensitive channel